MTSKEQTIGPLQKRCSKCGKVKPRGWFRREGRTAAGEKRWAARCRECRKGADSNHAAKRRGAEGRHTQADVGFLFARQGGRCAECGCSLWVGYHVDHVVPLARGGTNWGPVSAMNAGLPQSASNLQLLCARCNLRKGAKMPEADVRYRT